MPAANMLRNYLSNYTSSKNRKAVQNGIRYTYFIFYPQTQSSMWHVINKLFCRTNCWNISATNNSSLL